MFYVIYSGESRYSPAFFSKNAEKRVRDIDCESDRKKEFLLG